MTAASPASSAPTASWTFRPAGASDAAWMAELRAVVMRPDLERLGRFDTARVRTRFLDAYAPKDTRVIDVAGATVGLVALREEPDARWIEHFYLEPTAQGQGIGGAVLRALVSEPGTTPFRLNVLQGSPARRLYERHGFTVYAEDEVDVWMAAPARQAPARQA